MFKLELYKRDLVLVGPTRCTFGLGFSLRLADNWLRLVAVVGSIGAV